MPASLQKSRVSSVSTVTRLWAGRTTLDSRQGQGRDIPFSPLMCPDQLRVPPSLLANGYRGSSPGVKQPRRDADHSPQSSTKVRNAWSYTSTPQYVYMSWYLDKHRDNFTVISSSYDELLLTKWMKLGYADHIGPIRTQI
jgi:hypothetical protein